MLQQSHAAEPVWSSQASKAATGEGRAAGEAVTQANMAAAYTLVDLSKLQVGSTWLTLGVTMPDDVHQALSIKFVLVFK